MREIIRKSNSDIFHEFVRTMVAENMPHIQHSHEQILLNTANNTMVLASLLHLRRSLKGLGPLQMYLERVIKSKKSFGYLMLRQILKTPADLKMFRIILLEFYNSYQIMGVSLEELINGPVAYVLSYDPVGANDLIRAHVQLQ